MVNYMWNTSNDPSVNVEISGYILVDSQGNYSYWVNDWTGNSSSESTNPYNIIAGQPGKSFFDGKRIVGQVHTHPSSYYTTANGYDGPSYKDYLFSTKINAPVYSIGPHSVSVITSSSQYKTEADFKNLAKGTYKNPLSPDPNINPFAIMNRATWLNNPTFYKFWY